MPDLFHTLIANNFLTLPVLAQFNKPGRLFSELVFIYKLSIKTGKISDLFGKVNEIFYTLNMMLIIISFKSFKKLV